MHRIALDVHALLRNFTTIIISSYHILQAAHKSTALLYGTLWQHHDDLLTYVQEFAGSRPEEACQALLFYLERCRVLDSRPGRHPGHALALEVLHTHILLL